MFGISLFRRRLALAFAAVLAAGALAVVAVHANATGTAATQPARALSPGLSGLLKRSPLKHAPALGPARLAEATAHAAAMTSDGPTVVSCRDALTTSVTLSANLNCDGEDGLTLGATGITLNLDGHYIAGSHEVADGTVGVRVVGTKDTVENGYVLGFQYGVVAEGAAGIVTAIQADEAGDGFELLGEGDKASKDTAVAVSGYGMVVEGVAVTVESNHLLNNPYGLVDGGLESKVLDNIADGNKADGILVGGGVPTVTGNVANFNGEYGIDAAPPAIDGGSNAAMGNGKAQQCYGVACA